jgi:hypothetical protein
MKRQKMGVKKQNKRKKRETSRTSMKRQPLTVVSSEFEKVDFRRSPARSVVTPEVRAASEPLINWLNGEGANRRNPAFRNSSESTQRILSLLELVGDATDQIDKEAKLRHPDVYGRPQDEERNERLRNHSATTTFYGAFNDYVTVPYLVFNARRKQWGIGQWPLGLPGVPGSDITVEELDKLARFAGAEPAPLNSQPWRPYGEVMAAHGILDLLRSGVLDRVRKCECGLWFLALRHDSKAHNATCRKRLHDRSPTAIKKRREKQRANALVRSGKIYLQGRRKPTL